MIGIADVVLQKGGAVLNKNICFEEVVERSASTIMARSGGKC